MNKFLTTFQNEADYNSFLIGPDCPYVNVSYIADNDELKYYNDDRQDQSVPFTITLVQTTNANEQVPLSLMIRPVKSGSGTVIFKYKKNNGNWQQKNLEYSTEQREYTFNDITIGSNDTLQIKCKCPGICNLYYTLDDGQYGSSRIKVSGNVMSLFFGDEFVYATPNMFSFDTNWGYDWVDSLCLRGLWGKGYIVSNAADLVLPSKGLVPYTFAHMFEYQEALEVGPDILADYLPSSACEGMFENCTALTTMPTISAKKVNARSTFHDMFINCIRLATTTPLHIQEIELMDDKGNAWGLFQNMFANCDSLTSVPVWNEQAVYVLYSNRSLYDQLLQATFSQMFAVAGLITTCDWTLSIHVSDYSTGYGYLSLFNDRLGNLNNMFANCYSLTASPIFGNDDEDDWTEEAIFNGTFNACYNLTVFRFKKIAGPITFNDCNDLPASGTIYVSDNSVYLDQTSEYYGQTPISGWTVEAWSNYPTS